MMKKKKNIFGAMGLLALASCSSDELVSVNRDGDEIAFSVVTNSATRAKAVYCNNNEPTQFKVWATYKGNQYIDGDLIEHKGDKWVNTSGTRYWPDEGEVTFFAYCNDGDKGIFDYNNGSPIIKGFVAAGYEVDQAGDEADQAGDVADQVDLIYAVKKEGNPDNEVNLNFRHALSQIAFQAKNMNENLYVEIHGVAVCNVKNKGTFTYPAVDTDDNIEDKTDGVPHDGTFSHEIDYDNGGWGTWEIDNDAELKDYRVTFNAVGLGKTAKNGKVDNNTKIVVSLTNNVKSDDDKKSEYNTNAMLLLPQPLNQDETETEAETEAVTETGTVAWDVTKKPDAEDQEGTYFLVNCRIFNVAGTSVDPSQDVCLWGEKTGDTYTAKDVAIPVSLNWKQGKKYIYTFVFGKGNGGYNPDDLTPVLVPITFGVTVDDFCSVNEPDINMSTTESTTE